MKKQTPKPLRYIIYCGQALTQKEILQMFTRINSLRSKIGGGYPKPKTKMKTMLKLILLSAALLSMHSLRAETNCVTACWLTPNQWPGVIQEYLNYSQICQPQTIPAPGGASRYSDTCIPGTTTNACAGWQPGIVWSVRTVGNVPLVSPFYAGKIDIWCSNGGHDDEWCIVPAGFSGADFTFLRNCDSGNSCVITVCVHYFTPE